MNSNRVPFRSLLHTSNLPSSHDDDHIFRHPLQPPPQPKQKELQHQVVKNHLRVSTTLSRLVRVLKDNPCHNKVLLFKVCASEAAFCLVNGSIVRDGATDKWQVDYCKNIDGMIGKDEIAFVFLKVDDLFYSGKPKWALIYYCPDGVDTYPDSHIKFLCSLQHNQQILRALFGSSLFGVLKASSRLQLQLDNLLLWMASVERNDILCIEANAKLWPPPIPLGTEFHIPLRSQTNKKNSMNDDDDDDHGYVIRVQFDEKIED